MVKTGEAKFIFLDRLINSPSIVMSDFEYNRYESVKTWQAGNASTLVSPFTISCFMFIPHLWVSLVGDFLLIMRKEFLDNCFPKCSSYDLVIPAWKRSDSSPCMVLF